MSVGGVETNNNIIWVYQVLVTHCSIKSHMFLIRIFDFAKRESQKCLQYFYNHEATLFIKYDILTLYLLVCLVTVINCFVFFVRHGHINYIFSTDSPAVKAEWVTALNTSKLRLCK